MVFDGGHSLNYRMIGAVLIVACCAGFGFSAANQYRREVRMLENLRHFVSLAQWELQYRLTPLPELIRTCCAQTAAPLQNVFLSFSRYLEEQVYPQVSDCMNAAVRDAEKIPLRVRRLLRLLGQSMGRFALEGQLEGLKAVNTQIETELTDIRENQSARMRSYQILGLSAGAALAILLI